MLLAQKMGVFENDYLKTEENIRNYAVSKGLLPKGTFGERSWSDIRDEINNLAYHIECNYPKPAFQYGRRSVELKMKGWTLLGSIPLMAQNAHQIHLIDTAGVKIHQYHFLAGYIQALALIREAGRKGQPVPEIFADVYSKTTWQAKRIELSPAKAEQLLEQIYHKMFSVQMNTNGVWERYSKVLPIDMVLENKIESYDDYINAFDDENHSPWKYFAGKKYFDIKKVSGFSDRYFMDLWKKECQDLMDLTPGLWEPGKDIAGVVDDPD